MRRIEYLFSIYAWSQGKRNSPKPTMVDPPSKQKKISESIDRTDFEAIAERLGVNNG